MSEPAESTPPVREVGRPGSFLVGCAIALCGVLGVGVVVAWRAKKAEDRKRDVTLANLKALAGILALLKERGESPPRADGTGEDWTGLRVLVAAAPVAVPAHANFKDAWSLDETGGRRTIRRPYESADFSGDDGWGNPIRYRCPGVVHTHGWDLYSCGPNGKDDQGTFDDLLVGEDVAPATSQR